MEADPTVPTLVRILLRLMNMEVETSTVDREVRTNSYLSSTEASI